MNKKESVVNKGVIMNKKVKILGICFLIFILIVVYLLLFFNIFPSKYYTNEDFSIDTYISLVDYDNDGIDDQTDILNGARNYVLTKPKYKSKYYSGGFPNDEYGVCTDVVVQAFLASGYNLRDLVDQDIRENREDYNIRVVDKNIDFRRVRNLEVFFKKYATSLTTDREEISKWQGGDIVIFPDHIAIVSDKRNKQGISYIIHNAGQLNYEEDGMKRYDKILGHYRWN